MRNWNKAKAKAEDKRKRCFYSTYEELKQAPFQAWKYSPMCFYSTYEELKLYKVADTLFCTFSFYSTYEELKQKN